MLAILALAGVLVVSVHDGDSLTVQTDTGTLRVRLMGIDAPEIGPPRARSSEPCAREARDALAALVQGHQVALETHGTDKYGRTLAFVAIDAQDASAALLARGLARSEGRYWLPPARFKALMLAEGRAQFLRLGIWGDRCR